MTAAELLGRLRALGFTLAPEGAGIRVTPASRLPADLRDAIRSRRTELLAILSPAPASAAGSAPAGPVQSWPRKKGEAGGWPLELVELVRWFQTSRESLPREPFGLIPGQRNGWAVWVSDPVRFYSAIAGDIAVGPHGPGARTGSLAATLGRLRGLVDPPSLVREAGAGPTGSGATVQG